VTLQRAVSHRLHHFLYLASAAVCASVALALLARHGWLFELLAHFQLQYLVLLLALATALVAQRRLRSALVLLPFASINVLELAPYIPRPAPVELGGPTVEIMTANLNGYNEQFPRFIELVRAESPDVMVLLEVGPGWARALDDLLADYPHRLVLARDDLFGVAILSRLSLTDIETIDLEGAPAAAARVHLSADHALRVVGVHLRPPTSPRLAAERNRQLSRLAPLVDAAAGPVVVAGDFNATPYSPHLHDWLDLTRLEDPRRGRGIGITWPTALPLLGIPIDHCLVSEHFIVADYRQGPAFGSDHYPVVARLLLRDHE
jgi:endonuclease/exonuclease/phosphatase (EEP) superfamily protein YafD